VGKLEGKIALVTSGSSSIGRDDASDITGAELFVDRCFAQV